MNKKPSSIDYNVTKDSKHPTKPPPPEPEILSPEKQF